MAAAAVRVVAWPLGLPALLALAAVSGCDRKAAPPPTEIPIRLANNVPFVTVTVGASDPLSFILDIGASASVLNRAVADRLAVPVRAGEDATTGGGTVATSYATNLTLTVGDVALRGVTMAAIDLTALQAGAGRPVDGILGFDIFQNYIVAIDYARQIVTLHEPAGFRYRGVGEVLPIRMVDQIPLVRIGLTPSGGGGLVEATVEFDTGQTGALTLTTPFVDRNRLTSPSQPSLRIRTGAVLSGAVAARVLRMGGLQLGRALVTGPVVTVTPDANTAGVDEAVDGILGGEVLRRFTVIVDYSRSSVVLEPNDQVGASTEFDMSGMSLVVAEGHPSAYRVRTLIDGSPAADAGVAVGDIIQRINGVAPSGLSDVREQFRVPGRTFALTLRRGSQLVEVTLTTRRLV